ncbi:hypothetical protein DDB_G0270812 [Dictyostelium discoideum AX4]|uniref:Uncharacterized protein n=1 Tax=Dictyostelium discoideum TaxID=44689 RepID=Q55BP3_DICDI|nr:hypothetical protein DDB_G0270812 [Dictyostelium discoideum AX4]EAL72756.1 hypothetical protein DDB_G0270812 [Dictyostelium discoideum AX4]|eukprot:XP_646788.1 hypothetical protein DDB_G0270812 [Dictyostelium discoideum AX4]
MAKKITIVKPPDHKIFASNSNKMPSMSSKFRDITLEIKFNLKI